MKSVLGVLMATVLLTAPATAQSVVGRALVEGKVALLYDNGTWAFEAPAGPSGTEPCATITPAVQFCGQSLGWTSSPAGSVDIDAAYRIDARLYAQYIIEELGTDDGLNLEFMRDVVMKGAEQATGTPAQVIDVQPVAMAGLAGDTVTYQVKLSGLDIVFKTSVFVAPKLAMQVTTYEIGTDNTPRHQAVHADFLANTKLTP